VHEDALLEVHERNEVAPAATDAGAAVKVTVGRGRVFTVTAAGALTPPGPVQLNE
jgi:hypothetical protein